MSKPDTKLTENLDMANGPDRATLGRAMREGWDIPDEFYTTAPLAIMEAIREVIQPGSREWLLAFDKIIAMNAQNIRIQELAEKYKRLDDGQPTEGLTIRVVRENRLPDGDAA